MIGQKFGRLTVIEKLSERHPAIKGVYWLCVCDCGGNKKVLAGSLRSGKTRSCGCLIIEKNQKLSAKTTERNTKEDGTAAFNTLYGNYKYRAKKLGVDFDLSKQQFRKITSSCCTY